MPETPSGDGAPPPPAVHLGDDPVAVLARIFEAQNLLQILPEEDKVADFVCRLLRDIPGIRRVSMCTRASETAKGDIFSSQCNHCGNARQKPEVAHFTCLAEGLEHIHLLPLQTQSRTYGFIRYEADEERFASFKSFVNNLAVSITLALENLWQSKHLKSLNQALQAQQLQLERQVRELHSSEARFRTLAEHTTVGIFLTDFAGKYLYVNRMWCDIAGITEKEALNEGWAKTLHPDDRDRIVAKWNECIKKRSRFYAEYRFFTPGKQVHWVLGQAGPELDEQGTLLGYLGSITNISGQKKIEESMLEVDRIKTEFISMAAHELRTPLTPIRGYSEILCTRDVTDAEKVKKYAAIINREAVHLGLIVDDLLDVARIEAGGSFEISAMDFDLKNLFEHDIRLFREQYLNYDFRENFPGDPVPYRGDKNKLSQVLRNILSNAVKYSPDGGRITISLKPGPDYFQISVQDEGIGLNAKQISRVFEKFYRADKSGSIQGTGLGMFIVKRIIELHGGATWIESAPGEGTTVFFTLPLLDPLRPQ